MATYEEAYKASLEYFKGDELAADVFVSKYALTDQEGDIKELTPAEMHRRLAREFARIEQKYPNPMTGDEIFELLQDWRVIPQGSPMSGIGNPYQIQSLSNCYVVESPYDAYGGVCFTDQEQVQIMKRRGGVGFDISTIRPKGMPTSNAARTTDGILPFMERWSNSTREVAQGGRRGALLQSISVHHLQILDFINVKRDRKKVTGANISIRLTDEFMNAVANGQQYQQRWPVDSTNPKISRMVDAKEIWDAIIHSAWDCAEPGLLFWDNVLKNSPADIYDDAGFRTISTNPCISGDTVIKTVLGEKTIKDLAENFRYFKVPSYNEKTKEIEMKTAHAFKTKENTKIIQLNLKNGKNIKLTPDHLIFTDSGWIQAGNLNQNQQIMSWSVVHNPDAEFFSPFIRSDFDTQIESISEVDNEDVYDLNVEDNHNYYASNILIHNCSELVLPAYDSCRLLVVNILPFIKNPFTSEAHLDEKEFDSAIIKAQRLMDDLVDLEIEAIDKISTKIESDPEPDDVKQIEKNLWLKIKDKAIRGRRTGLGVTAVGDAIAALNVRYGSAESIQIMDKFFKHLAINSHKSSCIMAGERGAFPVFSHDNPKEKSHVYLNSILVQNEELLDLYKKFGRRNIANTCIAPGGSISVLAQTTSGVEPAFLLTYKRRRKVTNPDNERVDFTDAMGDKWQEYTVYHHGLKRWAEATGKNIEDYTESPYFGATANEIDWTASVKMQAAAQSSIDHSISRTVNLPNDVSKETVAKIYMEAWKSGCKGITVYRDGCRSGVLVAVDDDGSGKKESSDSRPQKFTHKSAPKRPTSLPVDIHHTVVNGESWTLLVGLLEDKPFEILGGRTESISIPRKHEKGLLIKHSRKSKSSIYELRCGQGDDELVIKDVIKEFDNPDHASFTRIISLSLRHGASAQYVVEQLTKDADKDANLFSFSKSVSRILKKYIPDGAKPTSSSVCCPECGSSSLIYQEGCMKCVCGWSRCS